MAAFLFIVKKRCFNNATRSRILIAYHEREEKVHQIGKKICGFYDYENIYDEHHKIYESISDIKFKKYVVI